MNHTLHEPVRVLSIDTCNRGVGFVVLETPLRLVDWGIKRVMNADPLAAALTVEKLIERYAPQALMFEDMTLPKCRRGQRARAATRAIVVQARSWPCRLCPVAPDRVRAIFQERAGASMKREIAAAIALRLPALVRSLPPIRKPWMSEDPRLSLFDAASFAFAYLHEIGYPVFAINS